MKHYLCGLLSGCYLCTVVLLGIPRYHLTVNIGQSMPGRLYACRPLTSQEALQHGDVVYFPPPSQVVETLHRIAPGVDVHRGWLKQIAATPGDEVCWEGGHLLVNQQIRGALPLLHDYPLTVPKTCQVVGKKEVLTLGVAVRSFDGRYSGPLRREEIADRCTVLF
jgi:type IV secretory pathway protease TraF